MMTGMRLSLFQNTNETIYASVILHMHYPYNSIEKDASDITYVQRTFSQIANAWSFSSWKKTTSEN